MKLSLYLICRLFIGLFRILHFRVLYGISSGFYYVTFYIVKYRKNVVVNNLKMAFPHKKESEIHTISREYYKHLADVMVESLKGLSMPKKSIIKRHKMVNPEILDKYFEKNISVIGVSGHYGNWEWGTASG